MNKHNRGVKFALLAFVSWGFLPIFWKQLKEVPALEILFHRLFWSFFFYSFLLYWKDRKILPKFKFKRREMISLFTASAVLTSNWLLYIWAVNAGYIVETSLGYFISPLSMILLGVIFLNEHLNRNQKWAMALCAVGVLLITLEANRLPWIALSLAFSFSFYGLVRKRLNVGSLEGGQIETLFLIPFCLIYFYLHRSDLYAHTSRQWLFLIASGAATGLPLLWFSEAAQRLPYYMIGFFQFIAPTLMFLTGVLIYNEEMSAYKLGGFIFIWSAMIGLLSTTLRKKKITVTGATP